MTKYYSRKNSHITSEAIVRANSFTDTDAREEVYSKNREALQHEFRFSLLLKVMYLASYHFRTSQKDVRFSCRGFFENFLHLANQFAWLCNWQSLIPEVEGNLYKQLGNDK